MNTSTIRFKALSGVSTLQFLQGWLDSKEFRSQISRLVTGSAQQNFGPSHLRQLVITLPSLDLQYEYAELASDVAKLRSHQLAHLALLDELFGSLQHRAFTGQL